MTPRLEIIGQAKRMGARPPEFLYNWEIGLSDSEKKHGYWRRDRWEENCNTCRHLTRKPHPKSPFGFLQGHCPTNPNGFTFHPHDVMFKDCYGPRLSKHMPLPLPAPNIKEPKSMARRIAIAAIALIGGVAIGAGICLLWVGSAL